MKPNGSSNKSGVKIDGEKVSNIQAEIEVSPSKEFTIQVGKRKSLKLKGN
ncbi:MAG: hypothetical protein WKF71_03460 [Pyrinomonadaceae bacterium]